MPVFDRPLSATIESDHAGNPVTLEKLAEQAGSETARTSSQKNDGPIPDLRRSRNLTGRANGVRLDHGADGCLFLLIDKCSCLLGTFVRQGSNPQTEGLYDRDLIDEVMRDIILGRVPPMF